MSQRAKKEFVPKAIYVTNQPVVVLPLERVESLYEILMDYERRDRMTIQECAVFDQRVKAAIANTRKEVRSAREHYKIQSVRHINTCTASTESK